MFKFRYSVLRSDRKTLVISVADGCVTVRAPLGMADSAIERFVGEKEAWILRKLREQERSGFEEVVAGRALLDGGVQRPVVFGAERNEERDGTFYLKEERSVRRWFERTRCPILPESVHKLSAAVGLMPNDVCVRDFKARWGCCDARGKISLNWRLSMLPLALRDYVIIHELCHLREMNHSKAFWALVGQVCPAYRKYRKALKAYSFLTRMYR